MPPSKKLSNTAKIGIGVGVGLLALVGAGYVAAHYVAGDKLPARSAVAGVPLGGLSPKAAEAKLESELSERAARPMVVKVDGKQMTFAPGEAGLAYDYAASVAQAGGGSSWDPLRLLTVLFGGAAHDLVIKVDQPKLDAAIAGLGAKVDDAPTNATLSYDGLKPVVTEGKAGSAVDAAATRDAVLASYRDGKDAVAKVVEAEPEVTTAEAQQAADGPAKAAVAGPVAVTVGKTGSFELPAAAIAASLKFESADGGLAPAFDTEKLRKQVAKPLAKLGLTAPKDARYTISKGKPKLVASVDGEGVDPEQLASAVLPVLEQSGARQVSVPVGKVAAEVTTDEVKSLGVKQVIGKFTTYFPGTAYRYNNIGKAAKLINGTFLMPGETFSMNQTLGKRTTEAGWMAGGAIDGGKIVERLGGGISQATTTTFNAIYFAGLQDIYHKPHSLYFNRYPVGREATLDWVSVDMKFKNDSPYGVLLQASITGRTGTTGSVTVKVWSTKRYTIKSTTPVRSNYRAPGKTVYDDSKDCLPQSAMSGFDVKFYRLFYQGKKLVKKEPFKWSYNSLTPVVCGKDPKQD